MIDAHQHFWQIGRHGCCWPPPQLRAIHRDFGPADLAPLLVQTRVSATVLVQSQPNDADTDYLCAVARRTAWILAVVGWADLISPAAPARIAELASRPKLTGLRPMLQDLDDDTMLDPRMAPALAAMIEHGLRFDALVRPRHLRNLHELARRYPQLPVCIDHGAKPFIARRVLDPWRADIEALAALPNVVCKLSGLLTEAAPGSRAEDLAPYVSHLLACFGPQRLMWGSDWPVLELAANYAGWLHMAQALTAHLAAHEVQAIFHDTAARFYSPPSAPLVADPI